MPLYYQKFLIKKILSIGYKVNSEMYLELLVTFPISAQVDK